jgi:hypothetical protein
MASANAANISASLGRKASTGREQGETDRAGIYEAWPITIKGDIDLRRYAFNVEPDEGDLTQVPAADLATRLDPVKVNFHQADQYEQEEVASSGYNLSLLMLGCLIALLVGEQALAYSASYHVVPGGAR